MRRLNYTILLSIIFHLVNAQITPTLFGKVDQGLMNHWVDSMFSTMSEDERVGQLIMVIADPKSDVKNLQTLDKYVNDLKIGGILFHKGNPITQAEVTNRMQKKSRIPLFIALDGEWGLSMRLSETTRFPKNMMLGGIENNLLIEEYGKEVARQCKEMGIHINFAPAVDINNNADNPVIGLRSFGEDPNAVAEKGIAYARGLEGMGIISVAKHFPGHGDTSDDSHHTLPVLKRSLASLDSFELLPFRKYVKEGFSGIMISHLHVPALDSKPKQASSMSKKIVTDLLKKQMGFEGICITDALAMKGADTDSVSRTVLSLLAGNDIALAPIAPAKEVDAIKKAVKEGVLSQKELEQKCKKILQYKYIAGLNEYKPIVLKGLKERLNTPYAEWLAAKLNAEAITLLKNEDAFVPLKQLDKKRIAVLSIGDPFGNEFQKVLSKYDSVAYFKITVKSKETEIQKIAKDLEKFDVIICGVYTVRIKEHPFLRQLAQEKDFVYSFFTLPYFCTEYKKSIQYANAVLMAYEGTPFAQSYAAQLIFGGISGKGKLSVTIPNMYFAGTGIFTEKTRLGFHFPEEVGINSDSLLKIDKVVKEGLDKQAYPGCQVLVAKDGMIVYNKSFGFFDFQSKKKVDDSSIYDLASASKAVGTLLAFMKAFDDKLVTLDTPISFYMPDLQNSNKSDLRVEELLYHQSGLPPVINFYKKAIDNNSYTGSLYSSSQKGPYLIRYDKNTYVRNDFKFLPNMVSKVQQPGFNTKVARHFYLHDSFKDSIMKDIKESKLGIRGKYVYSCVNFIILKMILENQTRKPMDQYLYDNFYKKLGADNVVYNPLNTIDSSKIVPTENDQFIRNQLLRGYVHDEAAAFQGGVSGNAGLFANANDLAKILQLLLNDGKYGGETYISQSTSCFFSEAKSSTCRRGLGFDKPDNKDLNKSPCGELAPDEVYGHTGYTGTCFWVDPKNQLIYIFLSNRVNPSRLNNKLSSLNIRTRIQDIIYQSIQ